MGWDDEENCGNFIFTRKGGFISTSHWSQDRPLSSNGLFRRPFFPNLTKNLDLSESRRRDVDSSSESGGTEQTADSSESDDDRHMEIEEDGKFYLIGPSSLSIRKLISFQRKSMTGEMMEIPMMIPKKLLVLLTSVS